MKNTDLSFEQALEKLGELSTKINDPDVSLEEAIKTYEEGFLYYKMCRTKLDKAEQRIAIIGEEGDKEIYPEGEQSDY